MPPETELIKQQMGQTRAALTEKMETLENKVLGTVSDTTDTVSNTVQQVGSTVRDTVQQVGSTVRETSQDLRSVMHDTVGSMRDALDLSRHVQAHPWVMLGGSVFVGYVGGRLLDGLEQGRLPSLPSLSGAPERLLPQGSEVRERIESVPAPRRSGSSFLQALLDTFAPELDKLKRVAIGAALGLMRDKLGESVPPPMKENFTELMDRVTQKLGGEPPPPGSLFGREAAEQEDRNGSEKARSMGIG
ncbi:MAG TPA: hypothetical protein VH643_14465 [Gemmataceae bacterium]|jgi:ElaB/YqjD/DUF883 family membrane-anchored ribosome-binding protein